MVRQIARFALASERGRSPEMTTDIMESDIKRFLKKYSWGDSDLLEEMFPYAVQELLNPSTKRRVFFNRILGNLAKPNVGYQSLARLMQRGLLNTVITTNFDSLIETALRNFPAHSQSITTINKVKGDSVNFAPYQKNQIIYLHGAVEFYTDRNTIEETERLDHLLVEKVRSIISYAPLIVIGYRGFEQSIMNHLLNGGLATSDNYKHGVYWCSRYPERNHSNVIEFSKKLANNFFSVQIDGFDETLTYLDKILEGLAGFQSSFASDASVKRSDVSFDKEGAIGVNMEDLHLDLLYTVAKSYAKTIHGIELKVEELDRFLQANEFAQIDENGKLIPTKGLYLLVGKDVTERFPHLKTLFINDTKQQKVFDGNLLTQFEQLREELLHGPLNRSVRIKLPSGSVEMTPYSERALIELLVNFMAHRDYTSKELSRIDIVSGKSITFTTPGGLLPEVHLRLSPEKDGSFTPVMNVYQVRNPVISDIFLSQGVMDKAGSGLVDVVNLMTEHYGSAAFSTGASNKIVEATLKQAASSGDKVAMTANPVSNPVRYITNILPFIALPEKVYRVPLDQRFARRNGERFPEMKEGDPIRNIAFRRHEGELWLFGDPDNVGSYIQQVGYLEHARPFETEKMIEDDEFRNVFVNLLRRSFEIKLRSLDAQLRVESKNKRAYFIKKNDDGYTLTYDSAQRRGVERGLVKRRDFTTSTEYENEGLYYSVVQFGESWGVQIKHFYVFTDSSGVEPLAGLKQTRRATKRYKFDRNQAVRADLQFWTTFLSGRQSTIDLGMGVIPGLVLNSQLLDAEVIEV